MVNPGDIEDHPTTTIPPSRKSKARARFEPHPRDTPRQQQLHAAAGDSTRPNRRDRGAAFIMVIRDQVVLK
jgi:hypothetical protein